MIVLRCDRCKIEHEHPTMFTGGTGHIGVNLPKGWEVFNGQHGMQGPHRNKQICPACSEEYHLGFLSTPVVRKADNPLPATD